MKIVFLSPADNYHTKKWCDYFVSKKHDVHVISFSEGNIENVSIHYINCGINKKTSDLKKIKYIMTIKKIKKIINEIKPDIVNAHYATSYGLIASLCGINNYVLSVWGSDIFNFPKRSLMHKIVLKYSLKKAPCIFSTSNIMAKEVKKYVKNKKIIITPFGVDMSLFNPKNRKKNKNNGSFVIGNIKGLSDIYGIDILIKACNVVNRARKDINLELRIGGKGEKELEYSELAKSLNVKVNWLGFISQEQVAKEWANMDVAVIPSIEESFGVSAIEAQASGIPLIVSDAPGLLETTAGGKTSLMVKRGDVVGLANNIICLYDNPSLRKYLGKNGRKFVEKKYEYNNCFDKIEDIFMNMSNRS